MNNTNTILQPITELSLSSSDFGNDLNDRLENINDNFLKIVQTDFLKGNPGNSAGVKSCPITNNAGPEQNIELGLYKTINDQHELTSNELYDLLKNCIKGTAADNANSLKNIQIIGSNDYYNWHDQLDRSEIQLIYETIEDKNVIVSSLPYVFLDNRFKHLDVMEDNDGSQRIPNIEDLEDQSCVIYYQKIGNDAGFQKVRTFPTIYYDKNIDEGNFCWMINNSRSGIPCKGPKGMDGHDGRLYVGFISRETIEIDGTDANEHELYCIIEKGEQKDPQSIQGMEDGSAIICFEAEFDNNTKKYFPITTSTTTSTEDDVVSSVVSSYKISTIKVDKNNTTPNLRYTVYGGQNATNVNLLSNLNLFETLLKKIGYDNDENFGNLDGLFIPATEDGSYRHILKATYSDEDDIKDTLKLSLDNGSGDVKESNIHIDYNNASIGRFDEIKMNLAPDNAHGIPIIEFDAILHPSRVYGPFASYFNCEIGGTQYYCKIKDTITVTDENNEELTTVCNLLNTVVFKETLLEELITFFDVYEQFPNKKSATYMLKWSDAYNMFEFLNKLYQGRYKRENNNMLTDLSGWGVKILKLTPDISISIVEGEYVLKIDVDPKNWSELSISDIKKMWGSFSQSMTSKSNVKYRIDPRDYLNDVSIDENQTSGKIWKYSNNNGGSPIYSLADPQSIIDNMEMEMPMRQLPIYLLTGETETNIGFPDVYNENTLINYRNTILLDNVKINGRAFITAEKFEEHRNNSEIKQFLVLTKDEYAEQIELLKDITQEECVTNIDTDVNINGELNCGIINGIQNLKSVIDDLKNKIKKLEDKINEMS